MKTIAGTVAIVPSKSSVDKTVKLIAVQILIAGFLIEAQFDSPSYTIVAADFGTSITASERQATEIELLRGEERTRRPAVANFTDHASDKVWYRVNQKFSTEKVGDAPSWRVLRNISLRSSSTLKARGGRGGIDRGKWRGILALGYEKSGTICGAGLIGSIAYPQ